MRIQFLLIVLSVSLLSACGPDTVMLPTDFIWRMNNKTEKTFIIKGSIQTDIHGILQDHETERELKADENCTLLEISSDHSPFGKDYLTIFFGYISNGEIQLVDIENGKSVTTWKYGEDKPNKRTLFKKDHQSRNKMNQNQEEKNVIIIEFDITNNDL